MPFQKGNKIWLGRKHNEKTLEKMKGSQKWLGKKHSLETRKKMSLAASGKIRTEIHRRNLSKSNKGVKRNESTRKKMSLARMGPKNNLWKGGISPLRKIIRACAKYRQWRSDVFSRDDFTCILCGIRGGWIEVDHYPKMFSIIFHENKIKSLEQALQCEEFWNINNGRTLCKKCHNMNTYKKSE